MTDARVESRLAAMIAGDVAGYSSRVTGGTAGP
jgi:hypothetical protein